MWDESKITLKITEMIIYGWIKPETAIQINYYIYIHQTTIKKWPVEQASIINKTECERISKSWVTVRCALHFVTYNRKEFACHRPSKVQRQEYKTHHNINPVLKLLHLLHTSCKETVLYYTDQNIMSKKHFIHNYKSSEFSRVRTGIWLRIYLQFI